MDRQANPPGSRRANGFRATYTPDSKFVPLPTGSWYADEETGSEGALACGSEQCYALWKTMWGKAYAAGRAVEEFLEKSRR